VRESADYSLCEHAMGAYERALALDPRSSEAMAGLAWVHGVRHAFDDSISWARKAAEADPRNPMAYGIQGDAALESGDYEAAFDSYQRMLDIRPDISSYSRGAWLLYITGDARKGKWLMEKAIRSGAPYAENTAWCRAQLALMLFHEGAFVPAQQVLEQGLKAAPESPRLHAAMGRVKAALGAFREAVGHYRRALNAAPDHRALVELGDLHRFLGERAEAERCYEEVERLHRHLASQGVGGAMHMARFYADHDRRLDEALRIAEDDWNHGGRNVFDADTLAWCRYKNGRFKEARQAIRHALKRRVPDAAILFHAGMICARLGERAAAQRFLHQALSMNPRFDLLDARVASDTLRELGDSTRRAKR